MRFFPEAHQGRSQASAGNRRLKAYVPEVLKLQSRPEQNGKYYAAANSTGYRWLESEMLGDDIFNVVDGSFYIKMVNDRVDDISALGDFEWFVSDDPYLGDFMNVPEYGPDEVPFA